MASEEELKRDIERLRAEIESPNVSAEEALIDDVRRELTAQNEQIPWFLQSFVSPPTDPLTVCLLALVEDLPPIPGPKTVGPKTIPKSSMHS